MVGSGDVMVIMLSSSMVDGGFKARSGQSSVVDGGFEPRSGQSIVVDGGFKPRSSQTKDYVYGICCFSTD